MILKLEFSKDYDLLHWDFVLKFWKLEALVKDGFNGRNCVFCGESQIMFNGEPGNIIVSKRGLRQGDPLSSLLFVLAVDVFF